jgi:hypothetical protein
LHFCEVEFVLAAMLVDERDVIGISTIVSAVDLDTVSQHQHTLGESDCAGHKEESD